jgi:hypothetical protein
MSVSDLQLEHFDIGKWFYLKQSYPIYWKMFQPYDEPRPSEWAWEDLYTQDISTSYNLSWFQQWNEVFAWTILISNQGSSDVTFDMRCEFQQYRWWWQTTWASWNWWSTYIEWKTSSDTWAVGAYLWAWVDPDEMRPWITQYKLKLYADTRLLKEITFTASNWTFDDTVCNSWYMWVEWANICYVPPCYYSWSSTTGYKHRIQYDTWYSWATWQTPWMIWIPSDSTDHHIYYTTSNWVVRRTKETYPRPYNPSSTWYSRRWHIWMTPSTSYSPEETWYNYICYIDWWWYKRRLWTWDVD